MRKFIALKGSGVPKAAGLAAESARPIVEVTEKADKITVTCAFPGFFRVPDERKIGDKKLRFDQLDMPGLGVVAEGGKPLLPSFARYVQIPDGMTCTVSAVRTSDPMEIGEVQVLPAQAKWTDGGTEDVFEHDQAFYARDTLYPKVVAEVSGPFVISGQRAVLLRVHPLQANPGRAMLVGHGRVEVDLAIAPERGRHATSVRDVGSEPAAFGNLFANPHLATVKLPPRFGALLPTEMLVIHAAAFRDAAVKLATWKNRRGLHTEIKSIADVGNTVAAIKAEIRGRLAKPDNHLRYVLLLGDADDITAETITHAGGQHNSTDYYYGTTADPSSATDLEMPAIAVGRIPVRNAAEALAVVEEVIAYEKTPPTDVAYYRRAVCAAYFQGNTSTHVDQRGYLKTMEEVRTHLVSLGFEVDRVYVSNDATPKFYNDHTAIPADVIASFVTPGDATNLLVDATTQGHAFIAHRDHGYREGWSHPPFSNANLDRVTGNVPSIFFSVNCLTGEFAETTTTECFAEKVLRMPGAAPSLVAATELSNTWLNNDLMKGMFDAMYGGMIPTYPGINPSYPVRNNRLGDILNYAKMYLPLASTDTAGIKDHFEIYHVLGDPSLEIWRSAPKPLGVQARRVPLGVGVELSECVRGTVVTVWSGDKLLSQVEPTSSRFVLRAPAVPMPPLHPLPLPLLQICCWAPGHHYAQTTMKVIA